MAAGRTQRKVLMLCKVLLGKQHVAQDAGGWTAQQLQERVTRPGCHSVVATPPLTGPVQLQYNRVLEYSSRYGIR